MRQRLERTTAPAVPRPARARARAGLTLALAPLPHYGSSAHGRHASKAMTDTDVDELIANHLKTMTSKQKERVFRKLIAKKKTPVPRVSMCRPRSHPVSSWSPKHPTKAKVVLDLLIDGKGVVKSNIEGTEWSMKLMTHELAASAVGTIPASERRSTVASTSMLATAILARLFELAASMKEGEQLDDAKFEMHDHKSAAGFARSRGSGLACNEDGLALIRRAAAALRATLESAES
jgi:hypothetical protein